MHVPPIAARALLICLTAAGMFAQSPSISGHWEGIVQNQNRDIRVTVDVAKDSKGGWIGSLDLADQDDAKAIPLTKIRQDGLSFSFEASMPNQPAFQGKISGDGKSLAGTANLNDVALPFELKRMGEAKVVLPPPPGPLGQEFAGAWEGTLEAGGQSIRLILVLTRAGDGTGSGTLEAPDQPNSRLPVNYLAQQGRTLQFGVKAVNGSFKGKLNEEGTELEGEWTQGGNSFPMKLKKAAK